MRYKLAATTLACLIFSINANATPISIFDYANGRWELDPKYNQQEVVGVYTCGKTYLEVKTDVLKKTYMYKWGRTGEWLTADILSSTKDSFLIRYRGEVRLDDKGKPVEWHFERRGNEHFVWRRNDWAIGSSTDPRKHCIDLNVG